MSNTQYAFIDRARLPTRDALQASITALGFDLALYPGFTLPEFSGFLPCTLEGEEGPGFEVFCEDAAEITGDEADLVAMAAGRDFCIGLVWRSSMKDLACVLIVSCALAKDFGAIVSYELESPQPLDEMLGSMPLVLRDARKEKPRQ